MKSQYIDLILYMHHLDQGISDMAFQTNPPYRTINIMKVVQNMPNEKPAMTSESQWTSRMRRLAPTKRARTDEPTTNSQRNDFDLKVGARKYIQRTRAIPAAAA